tara:strand:+ start:967 stop:1377 length:411 start_codon:yes stop_codon:yes gene_type:complete
LKKSSDQKDWENFLSSTSNVFNKDSLEKKDQKFFNRYKFDLHGYSIDSANKKVEDLINKSFENGVLELLIITGKGTHSKKKDNVYVSEKYSRIQNTLPDFVKNNHELSSKIVSIKEASKELGGEGALIIKLKNKFR